MPPKRRSAQAKPAAQASKPDPPKPSSSSKPVATAVPPPAPVPQPPPQPTLPVESDATRVRKEWSRFIDAWYEPQKKKCVEKLQKELLVKYKNLGPTKHTQKMRDMELFEKLDSIAQQLAQPARAEWERRLEVARLREDQWDDMSGEEQQAVLSVFVGFFNDDVDDMDGISAHPPAGEEDGVTEELPSRGPSSHLLSVPSALPMPPRQPIPPTPTRGNFELVNPTSFLADAMTPPNPTKKLPALSMDHLATLGPSNPTRTAEPVSGGVGGALGFQNWASEVGIVTQQPQGLSTKLALLASSAPAQMASARPRATDNMSRQVSTASTSSPQYSPPNPPTKFSPPTNADSLPLGKRYIGPVIAEEEPDPMDEELLKSKMADDYQQYKISLRIQMIYQFHAEAADIEIKLVESLLAGEGTKESRARAVQEHETSMMRLREHKEEERKRLCAEERERRRGEMRQHLAQRRSGQARDADSGPKAGLSATLPDKTSVPPWPAKATHQKENIPLPQSVPSAKLEVPGIIRKSSSALSQNDASANEALFANAMAMMAQGTPGAIGLTPAQASLNEALFSNAAATLAAQGQTEGSGKNTLQPPSIMKKSNSSRSQEYDIPQITLNLVETPIVAPEPAQAPLATVKGRKGKKGQPVAAPPPAKPVAIAEEIPEMDAEPPSSLWGAAAVAAKSVWGAASASISTSQNKLSAMVEDSGVAVLTSKPPPASSESTIGSKKAAPPAKKGKKVTMIEEPDVDADPIVSPPPPTSKAKATKGAWGTVNGKSKPAPPVNEESEPEPAPQPPPVASAWGKKTAQAAPTSSLKPQLKVVISEEPESEPEWGAWPVKTNTNRAKSAWNVPAAAAAAATTPDAIGGTRAEKKAAQLQAEPRRGGMAAGSKSVRADPVQFRESHPETAADDNVVPMASDEEEEEVADAGGWFNPDNLSYWANVMGGQSETETLAVPEVAEKTGKHVRWTPTVGGESDDEEGFGEADDELATSMWMEYAISGGDIPSLDDAPEAPQMMPSDGAWRDASVWERSTGKKHPTTTGDTGNRAQQTSVFDRAAFTGQWPKMDSWLSPPSRGQTSGSRLY